MLAAGSGSRFGADKLMHALPDGTPIAVQSARRLKTAVHDVGGHSACRTLAVVRPGTDRMQQALEAEGFDIVVCADAAGGMGHSLAAAVRACGQPDAFAGYLIALADMPFVDPATIAAVARAIEHGASIAAPALNGKRGHPVGLGSCHAAALMALTGDEGARRLIAGQREAVVLIEVRDPGVFQDIDTPADLDAYLAGGGATLR